MHIEQNSGLFGIMLNCETRDAYMNALQENIPTLLGIAAISLLVWYVLTRPRTRNLPPGPVGLPVIGNMFMLWRPGATVLSLVAELTRKYGKIFNVKMGSTPIILINDLKLLQESYVKKGDITSGRPHTYYFIKKMERQAGLGIGLASGPQWKELRRLSTAALRECGLGKESLEEKVSLEVSELLRVVDEFEGKPVDIKPALMMATSNIISSIIFGSRFDYEDQRFKLLLQQLGEGTEVNTFFLPVNFFPFLRFFTNKEDAFIRMIKITSEYIKDLAFDHEETFDPDNIRDLVDLVLKTRQPGSDMTHITELNMLRTVVDLFGAGSETTASSIQFLFYFMANYPDIQKRCQKEIDLVAGKNRTVTYSDKERLPFTEATVLELLRVIPINPFGFPHYVSQGFELGGYTIPEGAVIFSNILAVNNDPNVYANPEKFDPTRWLDENGQIRGAEQLLTFGIGPRSCIGEVLARMELFMYFASVLQLYTVRPGIDKQPLDVTPILGFIVKAKAQTLIFQKRL